MMRSGGESAFEERGALPFPEDPDDAGVGGGVEDEDSSRPPLWAVGEGGEPMRGPPRRGADGAGDVVRGG